MEYFQEIVRLFEKIPASFWGIVFGSSISILGIRETNKASDLRLAKQFENDRSVKAKEREMDLRKEIFLEATMVMAIGTNTLIKFTNLDLTDSEVIKEYVEKSPALVKLNLIANMDTLSAVANFNSELSVLFLKYYAKRAQLLGDKNLMSIWEKEILKSEI